MKPKRKRPRKLLKQRFFAVKTFCGFRHGEYGKRLFDSADEARLHCLPQYGDKVVRVIVCEEE